jgi:hypothetical protein
MCRAPVLVLLGVLLSAPAPALADSAERALLGGEHNLTLQWIGWDRPGKATVEEVDGALVLQGEQRDPKTGDCLTVSGKIVEVAPRRFVLEGEIRRRVSHLCGGAEAVRTGKLVFRRTGKRAYWRLQQMDSPCDDTVDYVDLFLRRPR